MIRQTLTKNILVKVSLVFFQLRRRHDVLRGDPLRFDVRSCKKRVPPLEGSRSVIHREPRTECVAYSVRVWK
jgi:hypothetical protein